MTNEQILQKAMEKAEKNGFSFGDWVMKHIKNKYPKVKEADSLAAIVWLNIDWMIYSRDFARAFWGEEEYKNDIRVQVLDYEPYKIWEHHLQQMVILPDDEKLRYLEKFI